MHKLSLSKSSVNLVGNKFANLATTILVLPITLNLAWLLMFIRISISSRLAVIRNFKKIIFNMESLLLIGNLSLLILFIACVLAMRSLKSFLGKRH